MTRLMVEVPSPCSKWPESGILGLVKVPPGIPQTGLEPKIGRRLLRSTTGWALLGLMLSLFMLASPLKADSLPLLRLGLLISSESDELFQLQDSVVSGIAAMEREYNLFLAKSRAEDSEQALMFLDDIGKRGFQLAVTVGPRFRELWREYALKYPSTQFVVIDSEADLAGVTSLAFDEHMAAFLMGVQASAEANKLFFLAAVDDPSVRRFLLAFSAGVRLGNAEAKLEQSFLSSTDLGWDDLDGARTQLERALGPAQQTEHLVLALGPMGLDLLDEELLKQWLKQDKSRRLTLIVGQFSEGTLQALSPQVDAMVKRGDLAIQHVTRLYTANSLEAGMLSFGLPAGGVEILEHPSRLDQSDSALVRQRFQDIRQGVIAGEIQVPDYFRVF